MVHAEAFAKACGENKRGADILKLGWNLLRRGVEVTRIGGGAVVHVDGGREVSEDQFVFDADQGEIYGDGSAYAGHTRAACAGAAAVQYIREEGNVGPYWKVAMMSVQAECPQTAAYAEQMVPLIVNKVAKGAVTYVLDCAAVVRNISGGRGYACDPRNPYGGLYREMEWERVIGVVWRN